MSTIYCPQCGAPNTIDSAFCASCGASLAISTETTPSPTTTAPPPPPPPTTVTPPIQTTYEQPELLPDGEPYLVNKTPRYHKRWEEKRFNELLALWEEKVAEAEKNAVKGTGLPLALIIIGIIALGGFVGIIILIAGVWMYSKRNDAKKNLTKYRGVLFYLRDYVSKYGSASTNL
ncbi:zinc ribbon domain-containing protein [Candidatus Borrarchaeum sp.]|uniref:zinc ribbon domain-containing protein n=1 Tax=Candidatus Borrarchaeum sp. TaxID=2846742 RepID=UPI00257AA117|nr:zinc ribbon domain-containing protein [Candidatus Borrarchaeum sp.]